MVYCLSRLAVPGSEKYVSRVPRNYIAQSRLPVAPDGLNMGVADMPLFAKPARIRLTSVAAPRMPLSDPKCLGGEGG